MKNLQNIEPDKKHKDIKSGKTHCGRWNPDKNKYIFGYKGIEWVN